MCVFFSFFPFIKESGRELAGIEAEIIRLKRHLDACPRDGAIAAVDEAGLTASIFQLDQSLLRAQELLQQTNDDVAERIRRWRLFEESVSQVIGLVKRLEYARNMASPKGSLDLQRLVTAKQSIEVRIVLKTFDFFLLL